MICGGFWKGRGFLWLPGAFLCHNLCESQSRIAEIFCACVSYEHRALLLQLLMLLQSAEFFRLPL